MNQQGKKKKIPGLSYIIGIWHNQEGAHPEGVLVSKVFSQLGKSWSTRRQPRDQGRAAVRAAQASFVSKSWQGTGGGGGKAGRSLLTAPGAAPRPGNSRASLGKDRKNMDRWCVRGAVALQRGTLGLLILLG